MLRLIPMLDTLWDNGKGKFYTSYNTYGRNNLVTWSSKKHKVVSYSAKAEYCARIKMTHEMF